MRTARWAGLAIASIVGSTCVSAQTVNDARLQVEPVVFGVLAPTSLAFVGDGDFLVLQKNDGRVRRVVNDTLQGASALDLHVHYLGARGLLGIATDPDFVNNGFVYLHYTESSTGADTNIVSETPLGNRVYRYTWNGGALVDPKLILDLPATPGFNHNGGIIRFGHDDRMYVMTGDLDRNGKLQNFPGGPDPDDSSVILRVTLDGRGPSDNPFYDPADALDPMNRYFAYGVRNSFGMAFDPLTGELWDTENGQNVYDEINRVEPGFNSGWEPIMGPDARDPQGLGDLWTAPGSAYSDPEFSWLENVAPTSIVFVKSPKMGCDLLHDVLVGDNNCGQIYHFELNASRDALQLQSAELQDLVADNVSDLCSEELSELVWAEGFGVITALENGPDGRVYVSRIDNARVARIGPAPGGVPDDDGDEVDDACDCDAGDATAFAVPAEVPRVRLSGSAPTLGWDSQRAEAGDGTAYVVVSGDLSGGVPSACTLQTGLTEPRFTDLRPTPPIGDGFFYLVRAGNACGDGTFGDGTGPTDPRDALDAVLPPPCP